MGQLIVAEIANWKIGCPERILAYGEQLYDALAVRIGWAAWPERIAPVFVSLREQMVVMGG